MDLGSRSQHLPALWVEAGSLRKAQRGCSIMQNGPSCREWKKSPIFQVEVGKGPGDHTLLSARQTLVTKALGSVEVAGSFPACVPGEGLGGNWAPVSNLVVYLRLCGPCPTWAPRPAPGFAVKNTCSLGQVTQLAWFPEKALDQVIFRALSSVLKFYVSWSELHSST